MSQTRKGIMALSLLGSILSCDWADEARADSLRAEVLKCSFLPYEPVAIHVDLCFDEPVLVDFAEDPEEAEKQFRRIPRRLNVKLRDEQGTEVSESLLFGAEFTRPERGHPAKEFSACGLAFFEVLKMAKGKAWELDPGHYTIVVSGAGRLQSGAIAVELVAPEGKELEAAEAFRANFPGGALIILAQEDQTGAMSSFEDLARDYPETIYGKYAIVSLALMRFQDTVAEHSDKGGAVVWEPVARELAAAEKLFTGKHPLREKVLFRLAQVRVVCGDYAGARKYLAAVKKDFPRGEFGSRSEQFEERISQREKQERSNGEQP